MMIPRVELVAKINLLLQTAEHLEWTKEQKVFALNYLLFECGYVDWVSDEFLAKSTSPTNRTRL